MAILHNASVLPVLCCAQRYMLFTAANLLSDGSELLLFIPQARPNSPCASWRRVAHDGVLACIHTRKSIWGKHLSLVCRWVSPLWLHAQHRSSSILPQLPRLDAIPFMCMILLFRLSRNEPVVSRSAGHRLGTV
jgi:hypothetical protein